MGRHSRLVMAMVASCLSGFALQAQQQTSIDISGVEGQINGGWDTGIATLTINGAYSVSVPYGQFSTKEGIVSWLGGTISQDPNSPANGQAFGSTLKLLARSSQGGAFTSVSLTFDRQDSSFQASASSVTPLTAFTLSATPNPANSGHPLQFTVQAAPADATGNVAIYDGGNLLGTSSLTNGVATLSNPGLAVGSHPITAVYRGGNHLATVSQVVVVPVTKGTPIITWPLPASIRPGTALSSYQLNATANVPGTFAYTPAVGTVLDHGVQPLSVTFTPTDLANYIQTTATTSVNVNGTQYSGPPGIISTFAGNGTLGSSGDGGYATSAAVTGPTSGIVTDAADNVYYCDGYHRVRKITAATGVISTIAGNDTSGYSGDGGPATSATINCYAIASDAAGDIFLADIVNQRIRKVSASTGTITTVAGNGTTGYSGDGGPATSAAIELQSASTAEEPSVTPIQLASDASGNIYFYNAGLGGNQYSYDVRTVSSSTGTISTFANGQLGAGIPAVNTPTFTVDPNGVLYVSYGAGIYKATSTSSRDNPITLYAGTGELGETGDGGLATDAQIYAAALATDSSGNLYFFDGSEVRQVNAATGVIRTVAMLGSKGEGCSQQTDYIGDGCLSLDAALNLDSVPLIAVDSGANVYVSDVADKKIRAISPLRASQLQPSTTILSCSTVSYGSDTTCTFSTSAGTTGTVAVAYPSNNSSAITYTPDIPTAAGTLTTTLPSSSLKVDTYPLVATYSGDATHLPSYTTGTLTVSPATPVISWSAPTPVTAGTPLTQKQLNASVSIPGLLAYSPTFNRILPVGANTLGVTFIPTDSSNYNQATATQTLQVLPATPAVSWATPAPIQYGTPLSAAQLNATANVAGTFSYSYAGNVVSTSSSTILPIGLNTLYVTFTPNNSANNTNNSSITVSVQISVTPDTPNITGILPNPVPVGATVKIVGKNFGPTEGSSTLTFNGVAAAVSTWSDDTIVTTIPVGATTGNVIVTVDSKPSNGFLLMIPKPCP